MYPAKVADAAFIELDRGRKTMMHFTSLRDIYTRREATKRACPCTGTNMGKVSRWHPCRCKPSRSCLGFFLLFFPVPHNLKHVHEVHGHTAWSGHVEEETNVESRGIAVGMVFVPFALEGHNISLLVCQATTI